MTGHIERISTDAAGRTEQGQSAFWGMGHALDSCTNKSRETPDYNACRADRKEQHHPSIKREVSDRVVVTDVANHAADEVEIIRQEALFHFATEQVT